MQVVESVVAEEQAGPVTVQFVGEIVGVIMRTAEQTAYSVTADGEHLDARRIVVALDDGQVHRRVRAHQLSEAGGEPLGGIVELVVGFEHLGHDVEHPPTSLGVPPTQLGGGGACLLDASGIPPR